MSEQNTHGQGPNDPHPGTRTTPPAAPRLCECGHARQMHNGVDECHAGGDQWECECKAYRPASAEAEPRLCECGHPRRVHLRNGECFTETAPGSCERCECRVYLAAACCDESFEVQTAVGKVGCPTHFAEFLRKRDGEPEAAPPRATTPEPVTMNTDTPCPCTHGAPCKQTCTCAAMWMSGGCLRCDRYGNYSARAVSPSRESGALLDALYSATFEYGYACQQGSSADPAHGRRGKALCDVVTAARAAVDRHIASLERDAARMREAAQKVVDAYPLTRHSPIQDLRAALTPSGEPTTTPETSE